MTEPRIAYAVNGPVTAAEVIAVFSASGIRRPVHDLARIAAMIAGANLSVTARDADGKLVGYARALTDGCYCCYLSDLAVDRSVQRGGIGKALVDLVRAEIGPKTMLLLIAAPEADEYYPKIGFQPCPRTWYIPRTE